MGLPKIPDPKEIAKMTAEAMQPMMDQLEMIHDTLERLLDVQETIASHYAVSLPPDRRKLKGVG
jgi:hypothetical protein